MAVAIGIVEYPIRLAHLMQKANNIVRLPLNNVVGQVQYCHVNLDGSGLVSTNQLVDVFPHQIDLR